MKNHQHPSYPIFILVLSIMAIIVLAIETIYKFDESTNQILKYADHAVCVVFFLDFLKTLFEEENKVKYFVKWGWLDLLSSIPMLDVLRWGRAARIMRIFRALRALKSARVISQLILVKRGQSIALAIILVYIILITVCSISVLHFEVTADGLIKTPEDAVWWSLVTVTGVGYGDMYPVTTEGRFVATILMFAGIALFGTLSGYIAAWFIGPAAFKRGPEIDNLNKEIGEIVHATYS